MILIFGSGQLLDVGTTAFALRTSSLHEGNPLFAWLMSQSMEFALVLKLLACMSVLLVALVYLKPFHSWFLPFLAGTALLGPTINAVQLAWFSS